VHQSNIGIQETNARDFPDEACSLEIRLKESLVKRDDFFASSEVGAIERNEISIFGERGCKGLGASLVPPIHQLLIEGSDSRLVSRPLGAHLVSLLQWIVKGKPSGGKCMDMLPKVEIAV
jgi:hypothetical protein